MKCSAKRYGGRGIRQVAGIVAVGMCAGFASMGCSGESAPPGPFQVDLRVSPTPPIVGPGRVIIQVEGAVPEAGDAHVTVQGESPIGAGAPRTAEPAGGGHYVVPDFQFDREGEWTLRATVVVGTDTVTASRRWQVSGR